MGLVNIIERRLESYRYSYRMLQIQNVTDKECYRYRITDTVSHIMETMEINIVVIIPVYTMLMSCTVIENY